MTSFGLFQRIPFFSRQSPSGMSVAADPDFALFDDTMRRSPQRWLALAGLIWRLFGVLTVVFGSLSRWLLSFPILLAAAIIVIVLNLLLFIALVRREHLIERLDSWVFLVVDVGFAIVINIWASWVLPINTLYEVDPYRDMFVPYLWGTVTVWTGIRGARVGGIIAFILAVPLQTTMAWVNQYPLNLSPIAFIDRNMWLITSYVLAIGARYFARSAAATTAQQAIRAGREETRAQMYRDMHNTALHTFDEIGDRANSDDSPPSDRLIAIAEMAAHQAKQIRDVLKQDNQREQHPFAASLNELVAEFRRRHLLAIRFHVEDLQTEPVLRTSIAIASATRASLNNIVKHAKTQDVHIHAGPWREGVRVTIRDRGCGFDRPTTPDGFGLREAIQGQLTAVGGYAEIKTSPRSGTKVALWAPN